ncbi:helix-hairpin-helix domain-containing protein [Sanguibacter massiliensis]|uniref:helix-hairpin-helix domain-containing protein n=1 Tax=Sanguibacter massiliensis TaxID=1973217 RepID=UPI000C847622|nr:helix-hairpin-helix domain-containing protein [Sanguibacter massiliensis]
MYAPDTDPGRRAATIPDDGDPPGASLPDAPDPDDVAALRARLVAGRTGRTPRPQPADHLDPGEPVARGRTSWAVTARSVVVGVVVVAVLAVALVVRALGSTPGEVVPLPAAGPAALSPDSSPAGPTDEHPAPTPTPTPAPASVQGLVVHVVGRVARPGVVTLAAGARVADAVEAAGGLRRDADVTHVNLARPVADGEQILVPRRGEDPPPPSPGTSTVPGKVDLNAADVAALDALPGIGPVLAQRIVDHREQHGPFPDVASLSDVSGIGPALERKLADLVTVG